MWKDSETEIDYLDYGYIVDILKDIICNDELLPASIGLYGDWGSGKSSLMHMCIMELENGKKAKCLIFNGWLFENYSDAKTALLNGILDAIAQDKSVPDKAKDILKGLYKSVDKFKYTIDEIGEGTSDSAATIKRFLRLSYLSDELLDMVDEGIIGLEQGLQVSYINDELQEQIKEVIEQAQVKMSVDHSKRLRQAYANGVLDKALIWEILMSVPPKKRKFVLKEELLRKFFDEEIPDEEIEGVIELALAKYIEMQGGVINYELHKSIKNIDTPEFERDVVAAWKIVKKYASSWNSLSALLRSRLFDEEGNVIHCARGRVQKELRNLNNELQNEATLQKIFLALKDAGFVTEYTCNNIEYRLKFKNQASKELIWDGGSVLELYTYLLQMRNSDDCKVGIHLDWDGVIQPEGVTDC